MESRLKIERLKRNLSQARIAEITGVDTGTVSRWECDQNVPSLEPLRKLCEYFGMSAKELGFDGDRLLPQNTAFRMLIEDPIARLAHLSFISPYSYDEVSLLIKQTSEEVMNLQPTRRDVLKGALSSLVFLPISGVQEGMRWDTIIQQCTIGIAVCQELRDSGDAADRRLAFHAVKAYLGILPTIAHDSLRLRETALHLAARCTLLKTILGWHCAGNAETINFAENALFFCKEAGDVSLQLSAYSKLAWAHYYENGHKMALKIALEAENLLERELKNPQKAPLPACIRGGTYSTLALMQAKNRIAPDEALGKAIELDPGTESIAFMEFTRDDIPEETGLIYYHSGNQGKAMEVFEQIVDPKSFTYKADGKQARIGVLQTMALSSLKSKDRDIEKVIHLWIAGIERAKLLQSEWGFNEALSLYENMEMVWPGEVRIKDLRDLIVHW